MRRVLEVFNSNTMLRLILIFYCLLIICHAYGQSEMKHNTIYFQIGGNGLFTSINYERQILKNPRISVHAGIGNYGTKNPYLTIPIGVNYLLNLNKSNKGFEFGLGLTYTRADAVLYIIVDRKQPQKPNANFYNFVPSISYRAQTQRSMMYRIELTPIIGQYGLIPFIGFSIGKSF